MKALGRFANKRFRRLKKYLSHFPIAEGKEKLHQIRLEIKKIKVLLLLIRYNNKNFRDHKKYIPFRTIFRECGKIRDNVLRKELIEQYTEIQIQPYQSSNRSQLRFVQSIPDHLKMVSHQQKSILKEIIKIKAATYNQYLKKKNKVLKKRLKDDFKKNNLHNIRKLIKEITYLTLVKVGKNKIDTFLTESDGLIGNWHDKQILIPWIRLHTPEETITIERLKTESEKDLERLKDLIQTRYPSISGFPRHTRKPE